MKLTKILRTIIDSLVTIKGYVREEDGEEKCRDVVRIIKSNFENSINGLLFLIEKYLEQDFMIQKLTLSYVEQENSYTEEIEIESKLLIDFNDIEEFLELNGSNKIEYNMYFSTVTRISSIELYYLNRKNASKCETLNR